MASDKAACILACEATKQVLADTTAMDTEIEELVQEMEVVAGLTRKCVDENSATAQNQTEYINRYNAYVDRYEKAKSRYESLDALRKEKQARAKAIDRFMAAIRERDDLLTEFDPRLWITTVDCATVHRDGAITFRFYDGTEITR